jgi:hypothetical protein
MELTEGLPVECYWNFHKKCYSVRHKGRVIAHTPIFFLNNVRFSVGKAGNAKVRREGRKNVHAFIRGNWTETAGEGGRLQKVTYNPYKHTDFMVQNCFYDDCTVEAEPIFSAPYATGTNFGNSAQLHVVR